MAKGCTPKLEVIETQRAIKFLKDGFEEALAPADVPDLPGRWHRPIVRIAGPSRRPKEQQGDTKGLF